MVIANSEELFSVKPNCEGVRMQFLVINLVILLSRIFSNNLENTDSREMVEIHQIKLEMLFSE